MPALRSDASLVAAARRGDRRAFAQLVERHYRVLLATCRRAVGDPEVAADAAQDAVVAALVGLDGLRSDERFGAWLVGIGLNVCRRALQERARWSHADEAADAVASGPAPDEAAEAAHVAARVRAAILGLPAGQRDAVAFFYLAGHSHAEVAERLGTRPGAVKTRLHKARAHLRRALVDIHREEHDMPTAVPMRVADVRRPADRPDRHIVVLEEIAGGRSLPIWIGAPEASALVAVLEQVDLPRPGPYHFAHALVGAAGAQVREVRISRLAHNIFYATAVLAEGAHVDARPSDAITLALVAGAPIAVETAVLEEADRFARARPEFVEELTGPHDGASILADEARARQAALQRELDEL